MAISALATLSSAAQAYYDVERASRLGGPTSLFLLVLAESGERKSSCDRYFKQALLDYEAEQADLARPGIAKYRADHAAWEQEKAGMLDRIRQDTRKGADTARTRRDLERHQSEEPVPPKVPRIVYSDVTQESLTHNLAKCWPAAAILSSEAGAVFGSHGMSSDSLMRTLAAWNELWEGAPLAFDRKTTDSYVVRGARLSVALQIQPATFRQFTEKSGPLARGIGFFARFLVAAPESTQGTRFFREAPDNWPALDRYRQRIRAILSRMPCIDEGAPCNRKP